VASCRRGFRHRGPALRDSVSLEAPLHESAELHGVSLFVPPPHVAADDLVALGHHVFDRHLDAGHPLVHPHHHLFVFGDSDLSIARTVVIQEVGDHVFSNHLSPLVVDEVLEVPAHERLHLIGTQIRSHGSPPIVSLDIVRD
jgi:hypothetical protein